MELPNIQIGNEVRPMTNAEFAQWQKDAVELEAAAAATNQIAVARASALAKLSALGLTEGEISALLGA